MSTRKRKSSPSAFARGNKAASKGEPRNCTLTVRIPASTADEIRRRAVNGRSRADVVIAAITAGRRDDVILDHRDSAK